MQYGKRIINKAACLKCLVVLTFLFSLLGMMPVHAEAKGETLVPPPMTRSNTLYRFKNRNSGKYLEITGTYAGANVVQKASSSSLNQRFRLEYSLDNSCAIVSAANPNLRLDISNAANVDGANVQAFTRNDAYAAAQRFYFYQLSGGYIKIEPQLSSTRAFEVVNSSTANGANVQIYTYKGLNTQQWVLEYTESTDDSDWSYMFRNPNMWTHISQNYNMTSGNHKGTDFDAPKGTPLYSVGSGKVQYAKFNDSMGYCAVIDTNKVYNGKKLTVRYLHMNQEALVKVGNSVTSSSPVGYVGNTGDVWSSSGGDGTHLHFDVNNIGTMNGPSLNASNTYDCRIFFPNISFTY